MNILFVNIYYHFSCSHDGRVPDQSVLCPSNFHDDLPCIKLKAQAEGWQRRKRKEEVCNTHHLFELAPLKQSNYQSFKWTSLLLYNSEVYSIQLPTPSLRLRHQRHASLPTTANVDKVWKVIRSQKMEIYWRVYTEVYSKTTPKQP